MKNNRKSFLRNAITALFGITTLPQVLTAATSNKLKTIENPKFDAELVKDFVLHCHGNFDKVKELYAQEPLLIFSSHDWGHGDFENGIEAAGHTGQKEIARFLLEKGARINFFTMCMLGETETVKRMLTVYPYLLNARGPHGLTALHHANQGKEDALQIKEYLTSLGASALQFKINV